MGGQLIEAEHVVRYALAAQLVQDRHVLDAGCGVGWGTGLLLAAGASIATGLDLAVDAVADARQRVPGATFVQGDLATLPWDDDHFDVVVCFEALEHVAEQDATLDELVRVLAPNGLLLVSSPNPRVYPAGNPFHLHEFTPEELLEAVGKRLANQSLWNQHTQISSVLVQEGRFPPDHTHKVLARTVAPLLSGTDPYSLVIAGNGPLPSLPPFVTCAPSDQLLHLEALSALVTEERERILAERIILLEQLDKLREHASSPEQEIEALRRDREHTGALLLESEQLLARELATKPALQEEVSRLEQELADLRSSRSWQITAPVRAVTRRLAAKR
jgi:SAM-dependent methyltransferase